jgi:hypothetical protein
MGSVSGAPVARLSSACGDGNASLQLFGLVGAAAATRSTPPWSPPRPVFPLARTGDGAPCRPSIERSLDGSATKLSRGGCLQIGS